MGREISREKGKRQKREAQKEKDGDKERLEENEE